MTTAHRHRPASTRTICWSYCVAAGRCSGAAHGNVTHVETCSCGATRAEEVNGTFIARGAWQPAGARG